MNLEKKQNATGKGSMFNPQQLLALKDGNIKVIKFKKEVLGISAKYNANLYASTNNQSSRLELYF